MIEQSERIEPEVIEGVGLAVEVLDMGGRARVPVVEADDAAASLGQQLAIGVRPERGATTIAHEHEQRGRIGRSAHPVGDLDALNLGNTCRLWEHVPSIPGGRALPEREGVPPKVLRQGSQLVALVSDLSLPL